MKHTVFKREWGGPEMKENEAYGVAKSRGIIDTESST